MLLGSAAIAAALPTGQSVDVAEKRDNANLVKRLDLDVQVSKRAPTLNGRQYDSSSDCSSE